MNKNLSRIGVIAVILLAIVGFSWWQNRDEGGNNGNDNGQQQQEEQSGEEQDQNAEQSENGEQEEQSADNESASFSFVAQSGDSFTQIARKAVQKFSTDNNSGLSEAAIVFAETKLTQAAGSPELNIGQNVELSTSEVESVVNEAKNLSESQLAAWSRYAANVNFDTAGVGEAK